MTFWVMEVGDRSLLLPILCHETRTDAEDETLDTRVAYAPWDVLGLGRDFDAVRDNHRRLTPNPPAA